MVSFMANPNPNPNSMAHSHLDVWCVRYECDLSKHSKIFFLFGNELEQID